MLDGDDLARTFLDTFVDNTKAPTLAIEDQCRSHEDISNGGLTA